MHKSSDASTTRFRDNNNNTPLLLSVISPYRPNTDSELTASLGEVDGVREEVDDLCAYAADAAHDIILFEAQVADTAIPVVQSPT